MSVGKKWVLVAGGKLNNNSSHFFLNSNNLSIREDLVNKIKLLFFKLIIITLLKLKEFFSLSSKTCHNVKNYMYTFLFTSNLLHLINY